MRALVEDVPDRDGDVDAVVCNVLSVNVLLASCPKEKRERENSPRRTRLRPTRASDAHAYDPRVSDLAERRREAVGHFAELVAAGGELVCAGGDVGRGGLIAGAGDCEGGWEERGEREECGGEEVHFGFSCSFYILAEIGWSC